ncbi:IdeS/Mac family cysteine endopeptidase [Treponema pedis]|uniref:IdeS/Mac family cysteine endopeptidase n=1 Tax=Treponema pedis TaxID=409322 RepID=UPI003D20C0C0
MIKKIIFIAFIAASFFMFAACPDNIKFKPKKESVVQAAESEQSAKSELSGTAFDNSQNTVKKDLEEQKNPEAGVPAPFTNLKFPEYKDVEVSLITGEEYTLPEKVESDFPEYNGESIEIRNRTVFAINPGRSILKVKIKDIPNPVNFTFNITADSKITVDRKEIKITDRIRNENSPSEYTVTVTKQSKHTQYKLGSLPEWIKCESSVTEDLKDKYKFILSNDSFFDRNAEIVFTNTEGKTLSTISVRQDGNYNLKRTYQWVKGVKAPMESDLKKNNPSISPLLIDWEESETTTWYNVVKLAYSGVNTGFANDSNLCWAMTGANMLHWWLEQNKENIRKYMAVNNITQDSEKAKGYNNTYNRTVADSSKSNIAQAARDYLNMGAVGGDVQTLINWYIAGRDMPEGNRPRKYKPAPDYFKDVFKDMFINQNYIAVQKGIDSIETLEREIKDALEKGDAIAIDYSIVSGRYGRHVVTIWGAGFDKNSNLIELWVADSNVSSDVSPSRAKLQNRGICTKPGEKTPYFVNFVSNTPSYWRIEGIVRLNTGEEHFKKYFENKK